MLKDKWGRFRAWIRSGLQARIAILYIVLFLAPVLLLGWFNYSVVTDETEDILELNLRETVQQQLQNVDSLYERMNDTAVELMLLAPVRGALLQMAETTADAPQRYTAFNKVRENIVNILARKTEVQEIAVLLQDADGALLGITGTGSVKAEDLQERTWYRDFQANPHDTVFVAEQGSKVIQKLYPRQDTSLMLVRSYMNVDDRTSIGTIAVLVSHAQLQKIAHQFGDSMQYSQLVADYRGEIVLDNTQDDATRATLRDTVAGLARQADLRGQIKTFPATIGGRQHLVVVGASSRSGTIIAYSIPRDTVFRDSLRLRQFTLVWLAVVAILSLAVIVLIFRKVLRPIDMLQKDMDRVERGDLAVRADESRRDEIGRLAHSFNEMVSSIGEKNRQLLAEERRKRQYEMLALQAQINPHFLYNTLDSIKWIAVAQQNHTIEEMTQSLIFLLRKTISNQAEFITLREELANVAHYIRIQTLRYYNSFDYEVEADEQLLDIAVPKLILQPLVENALFHGVYNCGRRGLIRVSIRPLGGDDYSILIRDNGRGLRKGALEHSASSSHQESFSGIGLSNVDERIKLYYGPGYGLSFASEADAFTEVTVHLARRTLQEGGGADVEGTAGG